MSATYFHVYPSPIGPLTLAWEADALTGIYFEKDRWLSVIPPEWIEDAVPLGEVIRQLDEYFAGTRTDFDLPLAPAGTPFQLRVWKALCDIPFGETRSYGAMAQRLGSPGASRAVGLANGRNPIPVIIPCHRVIGSNGSLTGYGGGLDRKRWLLQHERRVPAAPHPGQVELPFARQSSARGEG